MYVRAPCVNLCRTGGFSACRTNHGCVLSPVLSVPRAAIPLTFVLILRLCGATPVPDLFAFWRGPLRLLDNLHALVRRSCQSAEYVACVRVWSVVFLLYRVDF